MPGSVKEIFLLYSCLYLLNKIEFHGEKNDDHFIYDRFFAGSRAGKE